MVSNRTWVLFLFLLLVVANLACLSEAAVVAPAAVQSGVTAQGVAQAGLAGVVAGSDLQTQIEGERWLESEHANKHGSDAQVAREFRNNNPDKCDDYKCGNKFLRVCLMPGGLFSVTWYKYQGKELPLREDTVFIANESSVTRMVAKNSCSTWEWPGGWRWMTEKMNSLEGSSALQVLELLASMLDGTISMQCWDNPAEAVARIDFWAWVLSQSRDELISIVQDNWCKWRTSCPNCGLTHDAYTRRLTHDTYAGAESQPPPGGWTTCEYCSYSYEQVWLPQEWGE